MLHRGRVAWTYDVFSRVHGRIAAVHPESGRVIFLTLLHYLVDVEAFTAFVAGTPEEYAGVVAVAQHHTANAFPVHFGELTHRTYVFGGVCLVSRLVNNVESIFVREFEVLVDRRVVGSAYSVEIELLEYLHILAYHLFGHHVAKFRMLHVRALGVDFERHAVEVEYSVPDLSFLEAYLLGDAVDCPASLAFEAEGEFIEGRGFG